MTVKNVVQINIDESPDEAAAAMYLRKKSAA